MLQIDVDRLDRIARAIKQYPDRAVDIAQSFKKNQMISKEEVISHIPERSHVCVLGGWYGTGFLLNSRKASYTFVDIDPVCKQIGKVLWWHLAEFVHADALTFDTTPYDVIVNCSTEHMHRTLLADHLRVVPRGKIYIMQNSNKRDVEDHINCFRSEQDFRSYIEEESSMIVRSCSTVLMDNASERYTAVCISV